MTYEHFLVGNGMRHDPDEHHRRSIRLKEHDYSKPAGFFITICTHNRESLFGQIVNGEIKLSEIGRIAKNYWEEIPSHFTNAVLDKYVIMPNHIHGIILILDSVDSVGARHASPLQSPQTPRGAKPKSLGAIVGSFKSTTTKHINQIRKTPGIPLWQRNYYEHIIRNENELNKIREYIRNNPIKWEIDYDNPTRKREYKDFTDYLKEKLKGETRMTKARGV
jgi:REP element-mobilizing transposase RayT